MLIAMFLQPGKVDPATQLYPGQGFVQVILLLMAGVCVPWMLITKPYVIWKETRKIQGQGYMGLQDEVPRDSSDEVLEGEEEGNGRVIVESSEAEHVRILPPDYSLINTDVLFFRNNTISAKL